MPRPQPTPEEAERRRRTNKKVIRGCLLPLGLFMLLVIVIGVTTDTSDDDTSAANGKASKPPATSTPPKLTDEERASIAADAGLPPDPDPAARAAYLADLDAIDPDIVHGKGDKAVSRGKSQCQSIKQGYNRTKLIEHANYRFTSPSRPNGHGTATAEKITDVVHKHLCPDF